MTTKVTAIVRMPVTPPSIALTAPPISPMSEENRAASPAGASACSRARSLPTSRANIVLRSSVSIRVVTRTVVVSLKYWPTPLAQLRAITPSGPHQTTPASPRSKADITSWISFE